MTALLPIMTIIDEANAAGFLVNFGTGKDAYGRNVVANLSLTKTF